MKSRQARRQLHGFPAGVAAGWVVNGTSAVLRLRLASYFGPSGLGFVAESKARRQSSQHGNMQTNMQG